jgi:hypothetical protein
MPNGEGRLRECRGNLCVRNPLMENDPKTDPYESSSGIDQNPFERYQFYEKPDENFTDTERENFIGYDTCPHCNRYNPTSPIGKCKCEHTVYNKNNISSLKNIFGYRENFMSDIKTLKIEHKILLILLIIFIAYLLLKK